MQWQDITAQKIDKADERDLFGAPPELWKTIGDEVFFTKRIDHPWQAVVCMHAWVRTLAVLRTFLLEHKLNVKSTAWLADFPLRNQEIALRTVTTSSLDELDDTHILNNHNRLRDFYDKNTDGYVLDFIGPSIDTGFRVTSFASPRKLALSAELSFLLSCEQSRAQLNPQLYAQRSYVLPSFMMRYDGRHQLKGVLDGSGYPIFWIDLDPNNPLSVAEDNVTNNRPPTNADVFNLAKTFIESQPLFLSKPYMAGCEHNEYGSLSLFQQQMLKKRADHIADLKKQRSDMSLIKQNQAGTEEDPDLDLDIGSSTGTKKPKKNRTKEKKKT